MKTTARYLALLSVSVVALCAQPALDNARRAQALLGADTWSQVVRIENRAPGSVYPKTVYALVFELAGLLWFYTDADGTQSFSLHRGRLAAEQADFGPLLRDIEPGFRRWTVLPDAPPPARGGDGPLRNGCFIESVVALRERLARGARAESPRLLAYYGDQPAVRAGHTVLAYEAGGVTEIFDPSRPQERLVFPRALAADPLALARRLDGPEIVKARFLPVELPGATPAVMSAAEVAAAGEGGPGRS